MSLKNMQEQSISRPAAVMSKVYRSLGRIEYAH